MTIELTEEDAEILRELIAERKKTKAHQKAFQSFMPKTCKHGLGVWNSCPDCQRDYDRAKNLNHL